MDIKIVEIGIINFSWTSVIYFTPFMKLELELFEIFQRMKKKSFKN